MYACKQCGTGNPLDSSFCKKCGTALPEQDLAEARLKLGELLEEGNNLFTEGRTDEAMLISEAAVAANPSSHLAYSLKGLCHERLGQISEALECYEIAVGLNPDSALDKVKVAALRNRLAQHVAPVEEPNRRRAMTIAALAGVAVLALASLTAIGFSAKRNPDKNTVAMGSVQPVNGAAEMQTMAGQSQATPNPVATQGAATPPTGVTTPVQNPGDTSQGIRLPNWDGSLPDAHGNGTSDQGTTLEPVPVPVLPTTGQPNARTQPPSTAGNDVPPTVLPPDTGNKGTERAEPAGPGPEDPGYINIVMHKDAPEHPGGTQLVGDGNAPTAVLRVAQELYQMGKYDAAASKYQQVAQLGSDGPRVEQRIGDCYRNLGKSDQARSAYNRAINMYQAQIKQGHDVPANQRGLDSCESALKVLGG